VTIPTTISKDSRNALSPCVASATQGRGKV
jgi:hypothetical protein